MPTTTRFAPSPTGFLHLGHARAALAAWTRARETGGRFLLRFEDIDPGRCRPQFAAACLEDLAWLGLAWDGEVRWQSRHLADYEAALGRLAATGLTYPCFCTRSDIAAAVAAPHAAPDGGVRYPGTCRALSRSERERRLAAGRAFAVRLDMAAAMARVRPPLTFREEGEGEVACDPGPFGDVVLARRDAPCSYHLCVTHDDALQGVTLVNRGQDLRPATAVHRLLQELMGWPAPAYAHHPLVTDVRGRRLAKRDAAASLRELRRAGVTAAEAVAMCAASVAPPPGRS